MIKLTHSTRKPSLYHNTYTYILMVKRVGNIHSDIDTVTTNGLSIMESVQKYRRLGKLDNQRYDLVLYVYRQAGDKTQSLIYTQTEIINYLPNFNF